MAMRFRVFLLGLWLAASFAGSAMADGLNADVETFARRFGWPGAVALELDRTSVRDAVAYGACRDGVAITLDTPLLIGSVSKALTAQGALALADQGRMDLDAPLGRSLPGLTPAAGAVTARQLLTHTSGFTARQGMAIDQVAQFTSVNPAAAPGRRRYSNLNYNLLGALMARRAAVPFPEVLKAEVADPLGLATVAVGSDAARACGHTLAFGGVAWRPEPTWSGGTAPAGFLQASARDLAKLEGALLADPRAGRGGPRDPLIGWKRASLVGEQVFSHSGQIGGARATLAVAPGSGRGWVVVVNRGGDLLQDPVDDLVLRAVARSMGRPQDPVPWPWERAIRLAALAGLVIPATQLWRAVRAPRARAPRPGVIVVAASAALGVTALVLYLTGLTPAALWRLTPDLAVVLAFGPALSAAQWALRRGAVAPRHARAGDIV